MHNLVSLSYVDMGDDIAHPIAHIGRFQLTMQDGKMMYLVDVLIVSNIIKSQMYLVDVLIVSNIIKSQVLIVS